MPKVVCGPHQIPFPTKRDAELCYRKLLIQKFLETYKDDDYTAESLRHADNKTMLEYIRYMDPSFNIEIVYE